MALLITLQLSPFIILALGFASWLFPPFLREEWSAVGILASIVFKRVVRFFTEYGELVGYLLLALLGCFLLWVLLGHMLRAARAVWNWMQTSAQKNYRRFRPPPITDPLHPDHLRWANRRGPFSEE